MEMIILLFIFRTDELQKLLLEQMELRKKLERDFQSLKGIGIPPPTSRLKPHQDMMFYDVNLKP